MTLKTGFNFTFSVFVQTIVSFLLCASLLTPLSHGLVSQANTISSFGNIGYDSIGTSARLLLSDFDYKAISSMAIHYSILFSYDISARSRYPNARIIPWVGFGWVWDGWGLAEARAGNYILKDLNGNEVTRAEGYLCDPANTAYQAWLANECKGVIDKFGADGIFADGGSSTYIFNPSSWPINPRTGQPYTNHEYALGFAQLARTVKSYIGPDKILVGNGGAYCGLEGFVYFEDYQTILAELDGGMAEAMFLGWGGNYPDENAWLQELEWIKWHTSQPKLFLPWIQSGEASYVVGSYLLAATDFNRICMGHGAGGDWLGNVRDWLGLDFGKSVEDFHKRVDGSVYERDFTKTKVLVNPTTSSYTINIEGNYQTIDRQSVSSLIIGAHTGVVLIKG